MGLNYLVQYCPEWFSVDVSTETSVGGIARVPGTFWEECGIDLWIDKLPIPSVRERKPGTCFPIRCPERHLQADMTFCTGLHALSVTSAEAAIEWWEQLRQYICCQSVAEKTGVWPPAHALDHGAAGVYHEKALHTARELGIEEEYARARLGEPSWITDPNLRFFGKDGKPINGRAPCPMDCKRNRRPSRRVVRRKCPNRTQILDLVRSEQERKRLLADYWRSLKDAGIVCCGKMRSCGLK